MVEGTIEYMSKNEVMEIAITSGKILLCSGAETYRVEDTMLRICALRGMKDVSKDVSKGVSKGSANCCCAS